MCAAREEFFAVIRETLGTVSASFLGTEQSHEMGRASCRVVSLVAGGFEVCTGLLVDPLHEHDNVASVLAVQDEGCGRRWR